MIMDKKIGRNDPCPCGSGKKYKNCHLGKDQEAPSSKIKFKAKLLSKPQVNLMDRTFGNAIEEAKKHDKPPKPPGADENS